MSDGRDAAFTNENSPEPPTATRCHPTPSRWRAGRCALALVSFCLLATALPRGAAAAVAPVPDPALEKYVSHGHVLGFDSRGYYVSNGTYSMRMDFVGASPSVPHAKASKGRGDEATPLERVTYDEPWPGIRAEYDAPRGVILRSTWHLEPGADPAAIRVRYNAIPKINKDGSLSTHFAAGTATETAPVAWQKIDGRRRPVVVSFATLGDQEVGFRVGVYRHDLPLVIDPSLTWNTFLGGTGTDIANGIVADSSGNVFVTGNSSVTWGTPVRAFTTSTDAFVAKLSSVGALVWNTFLGGTGTADTGLGIALDASGNVLVVGASNATWGTPIRAKAGGTDGYVAKLTSAGALIWSTFLGAAGTDRAYAVAVDVSGNVLVAGTSAATWGTPVRAYTSGTDTFAAKLTSAGALTWNTFLGGTGTDNGNSIAVDAAGVVYVAGSSTVTWGTPVRAYTASTDAYAVSLTSVGALTWSTFLGGTAADVARSIRVDSNGVYVAGTSSATWGTPVRAYSAGQDVFAAKLTTAGVVSWNTFLGASGTDQLGAIALGTTGNIYVAGASANTWGTPWRAKSGGNDAFASRLSAAGAVTWNAFFGSTTGSDLANCVTASGIGDVYLAGSSAVTWGTAVRAFSGGTTDAQVISIADSAVCGNSITEAGEQCDDGNVVAGDCCSATCQYEANGTVCGTPTANVCDSTDTCNGAGSCLPNNQPTTIVCRAAAGDCDVAEYCDGAGHCPADSFQPAATPCGDPGNTTCDSPDTCNGSGACLAHNEPSTVVCRAAVDACDVAENCDGAGSCPDDTFAPVDTPCGSSSSSICDQPDTCDGDGACLANNEPNTVVCRTAGGPCDIEETCDGAGSCPADAFLPTTTTCRASAGVCDVAEKCTGAAAACPADGFVASTTTCRASGGVCDVAENCTGAAAACPVDGFVASTTTCRASGGVCDVAEKCTGAAAACPVDSFVASTTTCRASGGVCDVAENCTGAAAACPADGFVASTTTCRASGGVCDVAEKCTGAAAACPVDSFVASTTTCRASGGVCDVAENCTGAAAACPADSFVASTVACRASGGVCDVAENCTGVAAACPTDSFVASTTTCRASGGVCDVAENCTGTAAACPADSFVASTTTCRASGGRGVAGGGRGSGRPAGPRGNRGQAGGAGAFGPRAWLGAGPGRAAAPRDHGTDRRLGEGAGGAWLRAGPGQCVSAGALMPGSVR